MPSFKIEDLLGMSKNNDTVTEPLHSEKSAGRKKTVGEKGYQEHRSRVDTEELIKNVIREAKKPLTALAIARAIDRTASPHFRSIIAHMVKTGELIETVDTAPNNRMIRYWYSLP